MGLVAVTLGMFTLGAYLGRHLAGGPSIGCFVLGFVCIIGLNLTRDSEQVAVGLLLAAGLFLGLGLGGTLDQYANADPRAVWQSAAATALFIAALGSVGYAINADLSPGYRILFWLLLGLIAFGLVSLFVSMPEADVLYAVLGLVIFGLDIVNVFLFFLRLFGRSER